MSTYGQAEFTREYVSEPSKDGENGLAQLVRWIPGEVIAIYGAAVGLLKDPVDSDAAGLTWVLGLAFALLLALLGGKPWEISDSRKKRWILGASLVFTAVAFVMWSFTIPGSAGYRWNYAHTHDSFSVLCALAGLLLGGISVPVLAWIKAKVN